MLNYYTRRSVATLGLLSVATILSITTSLFNDALATTYQMPNSYTAITDEVFYDCAVKSLVFDFPSETIAPTGPTDEQLAKILNLQCSDQFGTEKITSLVTINLSYNQLTTLDLSNNQELTNLSLGNNQLTEIDLSNNPELINLNLRNNQLTTLDLSSNIKLISIDASFNQLTTITLPIDTELTYLDLGNNKLTTIDVSNSPLLASLYLFGNQLTEIDLSKNQELVNLRLDDNQLTEIDLSNNHWLDYLSLNNNHISDVTSIVKIPFAYAIGVDPFPAKINNQTLEYTVTSPVYDLPTLFCSSKTIYAVWQKVEESEPEPEPEPNPEPEEPEKPETPETPIQTPDTGYNPSDVNGSQSQTTAEILLSLVFISCALTYAISRLKAKSPLKPANP